MSKKRKNKKNKKILKSLSTIIALVLAIVLGAGVICRVSDGEAPSKEAITNPFITSEKALVSAHRSGADIAPENTMMAFQYCVETEDFNV
ncbi:MAG: hypothetical protein IIW72_02910, partial [Clostridia bacterium]|nr:hypothetical protein [Clostridia bacterium]